MIRWLAQMIGLAVIVLTACVVAATVSNTSPVDPSINGSPGVWPAYAAQVSATDRIAWGAILEIRCGFFAGSAVHIGKGRYLTAAHVAKGENCKAGDLEFTIIKVDGKLDIAEMSARPIPDKIEVDCGGLKKNRHYLAVGYVPNLGRITMPLIYSNFERHPDNGNGMFVGPDAIPGMSGGALINEEARLPGIVVQRWPSRARALADTFVCRRA